MKKILSFIVLTLAAVTVLATENNNEMYLDFDDHHIPEHVTVSVVPQPNFRAIERSPRFNEDIQPMDFDDHHIPEHVTVNAQPIFLDFDDHHIPEHVTV